MRSRRPHTLGDPLVEYSSIEEFESSAGIPCGRFSVMFKGIPVDFLYDNRGYDTTIVCFHGAVDVKVNLPWHTAEGVMKDVAANRLAISDPSLVLGDGLKLAWFGGSSKQVGLQGFIEQVIRAVNNKASNQHVVFFGGSGGGFSSLEMSERFSGSLALPMNPQTSIAKYVASHVNRYVDKAWASERPFTEDQALLRHDLPALYPEIPPNTIGYVQNTRDSFHIEEHQKPFIERVGASGKVWTLMEAWGDPARSGHVTPPKEVTAKFLKVVAACNGEWETGLKIAGFTQ